MKKIEKIDTYNLIRGIDVTQEKEVSWESMAAEAYVSVVEEIPKQPIAISIGETEYKGNRYPIPFGSYGDYSCIVGSSKSKKTFLKSAVLSCYQGGKSDFFFDNIVGHLAKGKYVIDVDTEQSRWHSQRVFKRVPAMVGAISPYYKSYSLRRFSAKERMGFIDWLIYKSPFRDNIGLISIDGYADLVDDFNSVEQSNILQQRLLSWTTDGGCHITGILHKNFNSQKPVGHVGSAVLKKAETIAFIEKLDKLTSKVVCEYSRNMPFDEFTFKINQDWLPEKSYAF